MCLLTQLIYLFCNLKFTLFHQITSKYFNASFCLNDGCFLGIWSHKSPDSVLNLKAEFDEGAGKVPLDTITKLAKKYQPPTVCPPVETDVVDNIRITFVIRQVFFPYQVLFHKSSCFRRSFLKTSAQNKKPDSRKETFSCPFYKYLRDSSRLRPYSFCI